MPCTTTIEATGFAQLFLEGIIQLQGVPRKIVSDRDVDFTSDFWTEVIKRLQTKLLMSTAFHPQTDGLSEISNKQVTRYLQAFATHHQEQWDTMLPQAEYAYNTSTHSSTDRSLFELDLGYTPSIPLDFVASQRDEMQSLEGTAFVERLQASLLDAQDRLRVAQDTQMVQANKSRWPCTLQVGDLVMLNTKDLPITYTSQDPSLRKLQHPRAGPYRIIKFRGPNAVELELPTDMAIHDTVNVSRVKKYIADPDPARDKPPPPPVLAVIDKHGTIQRSYVV
jgi:hypothetical protein